MNRWKAFFLRCLRVVLIAIFVAVSGSDIGGRAGLGGVAFAQTPADATVSANDVSWLFPAPTLPEDFAMLIAVRDLTAPNPQNPSKRDLVWPYEAFQRFLAIAASRAAQVGDTQSRIVVPTEAQSIDAWFIAGVRIDPGAPGLSNDIRGQFGQSAEIRLIVQPVTRAADGTPQVLDFAAHLIFDFRLAPDDPEAEAGCLPRPRPDIERFRAIVAELAALRTKLSNGQLGANRVSTSGVPLGVHPGLADATTVANVRLEMKAFLERHISGQRLNAMAIMGVPAPAAAPWIFLSMVKVPPGLDPALPNGGFDPVHGPTLDGQQFSQMLIPGGTVVPAPNTNNLNTMTCKNAALSPISLPIAQRRGSSTADLSARPQPTPDKIKEVLDTITDPTRSHFFNTDCVSCHTETRRAMGMLQLKDVSGINPAVLPTGDWNVHNFGWSPRGEGQAATVTRRTSAETSAVVAFINSQLLNK